MSERFIRLEEILAYTNASNLNSHHKSPAEAREFVPHVLSQIDHSKWRQLHGGHRNVVLLRKEIAQNQEEDMRIYWRQSEVRWPQIIKAILVEDVMSRHLGVPGRQLLDPSLPIQFEDGLAVTKLRYVAGDYRYPWQPLEIESAAKLMGKLHESLRLIKFGPNDPEGNPDSQLVHLDFGRGNVLFGQNSPKATAVIDYENISRGSVEQELGRTLSLLLVDTQLTNVDGSPYTPSTGQYSDVSRMFDLRLRALLDTYPDKYNRQNAIIWADSYLMNEDYGGLNHVRDMARHYLET